MAVHTEAIQKLYVAYFSRPADYDGLAHWEKVLDQAQGNLDLVSSSFAQSPEFKALTAGQTHEQIINQIYKNLFNRDADPSGMAFWTARLREGTFSVDQIFKVIADNASDSDAPDRTTYANKVTAATALTAEFDTAIEVIAYTDAKSVNVAKAWLSTIGDSASLNHALEPENLDKTVGEIVDASVIIDGSWPMFSLTTGVDTLKGTWRDDQFEGTFSSGPASGTLGAQDTIDGGGGRDTLLILGESGTLTLPKLSNVETILLANQSETGKLVLTLTSSTGLESISGRTAGQLTIDLSAHEGAPIRVRGGDGADTLTASMGINAQADELTGAYGDDTLFAGSGGARLAGGAGADRFVLAPTAAGFGTNNASTYSMIEDFTAGDLLQLKWLDGAAVPSVTAFAKLGASLNESTAVFSNYVNAAIAQAHAGEAVWFSYQGNAYVVVDSGAESAATFAAGQDLIVQLTGVDLTEVSFNAQFGTIALA
ncbi:MAG: DUF4214 domain-containing protein [Pseudomonadota bacterium]